MRACLLATWLARIQGLPEPEAAVVYATTLASALWAAPPPRWSTPRPSAATTSGSGPRRQVDPTMPAEALGLLWGLGDGSSPLARVRLVAHALPGPSG